MEIRLLESTEASRRLMGAIEAEFNDSRFNVPGVRWKSNKVLVLGSVRLKEAKPYCGSHPDACDVGVGHRKSRVLEGADWVELNDRINDVLDRLDISANVRSAVCILRKGRYRRIRYGGENAELAGLEPEWNKDESDAFYLNYCGLIAPASLYPAGTPGLYERMVNA